MIYFLILKYYSDPFNFFYDFLFKILCVEFLNNCFQKLEFQTMELLHSVT